jgi:hypothetical protein
LIVQSDIAFFIAVGAVVAASMHFGKSF